MFNVAHYLLTLIPLSMMAILAWTLSLKDNNVTLVDTLWALFASTLNISLNWLKKYTLLAYLLGAVSGPLCYWAGERLGALHLVNFNMAMVYLAVGWAIAVPLLLKVASTLLNKETNRV